MELIDIGCNLTHDSFDEDLDAVLENARSAGVAQFIVTGASHEGMQKAFELAQAYPGELFATAGVHPASMIMMDDSAGTLLDRFASYRAPKVKKWIGPKET